MRLIDADALAEKLVAKHDGFHASMLQRLESCIVLTEIEKCLTVDAVPVVHGKWIFKGTAYACSICGEGSPAPCFSYCRGCGARMDAKEGTEKDVHDTEK